MSTLKRIIVTGASGVLGHAVIPRLLALPDDIEVVALARNRGALAAALNASLSGSHRDRLRLIACDLTMETTPAAIDLSDCASTILVHCAADVAWHKTYEELYMTNVKGTLHAARLARDSSSEVQTIYVSSAFAVPDQHGRFRNAYEETKAEAEVELRSRFPEQAITSFACSLVAGDSVSGQINRLHGIYPLFRLINRLQPPFLVGNRSTPIDLVPVDWVADELVGVVGSCLNGSSYQQSIVASLGSRSPRFDEIVDSSVAHINTLRSGERLDPVELPPILSMRQYRFLQRTLLAWELGSLRISGARVLERLVRIYDPYLSRGQSFEPVGVSRAAPSVDCYLPKVIEHWYWRDGGHIIREGADSSNAQDKR